MEREEIPSGLQEEIIEITQTYFELKSARFFAAGNCQHSLKQSPF